MEDRLSKPVRFKSGVRWEPTEYQSIDQTPYLAYLEKNEDRNELAEITCPLVRGVPERVAESRMSG